MKNQNKKLIVSPENLNGILVDMTAEEITEKENIITESVTKKQSEKDAETAKAAAQVSGNTKLLGLGLSQEEATALTGYTPSED